MIQRSVSAHHQSQSSRPKAEPWAARVIATKDYSGAPQDFLAFFLPRRSRPRVALGFFRPYPTTTSADFDTFTPTLLVMLSPNMDLTFLDPRRTCVHQSRRTARVLSLHRGRGRKRTLGPGGS